MQSAMAEFRLSRSRMHDTGQSSTDPFRCYMAFFGPSADNTLFGCSHVTLGFQLGLIMRIKDYLRTAFAGSPDTWISIGPSALWHLLASSRSKLLPFSA